MLLTSVGSHGQRQSLLQNAGLVINLLFREEEDVHSKKETIKHMLCDNSCVCVPTRFGFTRAVYEIIDRRHFIFSQDSHY